jgi:hypothetical protein
MILFDSEQNIKSTKIDLLIALVVGNSLNVFCVMPLGLSDILKQLPIY